MRRSDVCADGLEMMRERTLTEAAFRARVRITTRVTINCVQTADIQASPATQTRMSPDYTYITPPEILKVYMSDLHRYLENPRAKRPGQFQASGGRGPACNFDSSVACGTHSIAIHE